jgi:eukaryotic-like serine/threonine-protein kinase
MSVSVGSHLGPYEIVSMLGAGGMGEVYRARDARLGRDVALKLLPKAFSSDDSRRARFEHEARAVAALNHPNIVSVYDVGSQDSVSYMASELVEGESLRALIERGPVPPRRMIDIGAQLADGLSAAHHAGIVHRDLKPENIMLAREGRVKILDFGLARQTVSGGPAEATRTIVATATLPGSILGTVAYMSPEQVRGQVADYRSDIFSLGTILHEMITGAQPFRGDSSVETMNAVLKEDPSGLPAGTPPSLALIVARCLEKDPGRRFQSASDLAFALRSALSTSLSAPAIAVAGSRPGSRVLALLISGAALAAIGTAAAVFWPRTPQPLGRLVHVVLPMPAGDRLIPSSVAVSRDGNRVAYVGRRSGQSQIFVRDLDKAVPRLLAGTDEGTQPLFSYRGDSVFFLQQQKLKRIPVTGGTVTEIAGNQVPRGFSSLPDGSIIGIPAFENVIKAYDPDTRAERTLFKGDSASMMFSPEAVNGRAILYTRGQRAAPPSIYVRPLDGQESGPVVENAAVPRYAGGYLLYNRMGTLGAIPFDAAKLKATGAPMRISAGLENIAAYDAAAEVLAYVTGDARLGSRQLAVVERSGASREIVTLDGDFVHLALSPDGRHVALGSYGDEGDVWTYDLDRGVVSRLTFEKEEEETPIWSPDGRRIAYAANRNGKRVIAVRAADGSGAEQIIATLQAHAHLHSWSPDGKTILLSLMFYTGQNDVWIIPADGSAAPREFLRSPFSKLDATFSPDGKWVSYTSNETGRREVYITAFPGAAGKLQISNMGGQSAVWSQDGRELYYRDRNHIMAVSLQAGPQMKAGPPRPIFDAPDYAAYAATPGGRFVALPIDVDKNPAELHVVLNWRRALKPVTVADTR